MSESNELKFLVKKSNRLIQRTYWRLTCQQFDLLSYIISKIAPNDEPNKLYTLSIDEYCKACNKKLGNETGWYYKSIKDDLIAISNMSTWFMTADRKREYIVRWFNNVYIEAGTGEVGITFHDTMKPFLYDLSQRFMFYPVENSIALPTIHSKFLYDLLKSIQHMTDDFVYDLDYLKDILCSDKYKMFADFKRYVLDKAISEVNTYTDIQASYKTVKKGRKVTGVIFNVRQSTPTEAAAQAAARALILDSDEIQRLHDFDLKNQESINKKTEDG